MTTELSVSHLIANASIFVQLIMLILFAMFLTTLFITGKKIMQFMRLKKSNRQFDKIFWSGEFGLQELYERYKNQEDLSINLIFISGFYEFSQFRSSDLKDQDVILANCRRAMEVARGRMNTAQERFLNLLATFGSSAPYIGLLGTVYGIMTSFIALGGAQQTSINSVAPGIAEALIATAIGLLAAIPSVLSYNFFIAQSDGLDSEYEAFIEEFSNLLQRQILHIRREQRG